jgi:hypothetical protein
MDQNTNSATEDQIGGKEYNETAGRKLAEADVLLTQAARDAATQGSNTQSRGKEIANLLQQTSTGPGAYIGHGVKALFGDNQDLTNLSSIKRLGGQGVFGDLDKLKGAISDKDVAFLREQQAGPGKFGEENQRIVNLMDWTGKRTKAYEQAQNAWASKLKSPSATNAQRQSFQGWWNDWSEKNIPRPDISTPKPQGGGRFTLISVEDVK